MLGVTLYFLTFANFSPGIAYLNIFSKNSVFAFFFFVTFVKIKGMYFQRLESVTISCRPFISTKKVFITDYANRFL